QDVAQRRGEDPVDHEAPAQIRQARPEALAGSDLVGPGVARRSDPTDDVLDRPITSEGLGTGMAPADVVADALRRLRRGLARRRGDEIVFDGHTPRMLRRHRDTSVTGSSCPLRPWRIVLSAWNTWAPAPPRDQS